MLKKKKKNNGRLSHIIFKAGHPWVKEKGKEGIRTKVRIF